MFIAAVLCALVVAAVPLALALRGLHRPPS